MFEQVSIQSETKMSQGIVMIELVFTSRPTMNPNFRREYVAYVKGTRVGSGTLRLVPTRNDHLPPGWENHIYYEIDALYRGRGLGLAHQLLAALLREAWAAGLDEIRLTCAQDNEASRSVIEKAGGMHLAEYDAPSGIWHLYLVRRT
jgi:predicted acetyltransferase